MWPAYRLFYDDAPADVEHAFRSKSVNAEPIKGVSSDEALDREIVERVR